MAPVEPTKLQTVHVDVKGSTAEPVVVEKEDAASSTSEGESGLFVAIATNYILHTFKR